MKLASIAMLLMAAMAFVVAGCSDNSTVPVSPIDQASQAPSSLEKPLITPFTGGDYPIPPYVLDGGVAKDVGKRHIVQGFKMYERWVSSSDLMDGEWINEVNVEQDVVTGEGEVHGKVLLTPYKDVDGGVWEGEYHGMIVKSETPGIWIANLSGLGHGRGGTIHGMKYTVQVTLKVYGFPATYWVGSSVGEIQTQ